MEKRTDKVWTVKELIEWSTQYFAGKGVESARLTAELLLSDALKTERLNLYLNFDKPLMTEELATFRDYVRRKANREPVQYITGKAPFMDLFLSVNPSVLIPRPETELLVSEVFKNLGNNGYSGRALDIGTGSGCISIALAKKYPNSFITSLDVSYDAIRTAEKNARDNDTNNVEFKKCDILKEIPLGAQYDLIVSNPPYIPRMEIDALMPEVKSYEPMQALTDNAGGLAFFERFAEIFPKILKSDGCFFLEIGHGQWDKVSWIFKNSGYDLKLIRDYAGLERIVYFTG